MTVAAAKTHVRGQEPLETELLLQLKPPCTPESVFKGTVKDAQTHVNHRRVQPKVSTDVRGGDIYGSGHRGENR